MRIGNLNALFMVFQYPDKELRDQYIYHVAFVPVAGRRLFLCLHNQIRHDGVFSGMEQQVGHLPGSVKGMPEKACQNTAPVHQAEKSLFKSTLAKQDIDQNRIIREGADRMDSTRRMDADVSFPHIYFRVVKDIAAASFYDTEQFEEGVPVPESGHVSHMTDKGNIHVGGDEGLLLDERIELLLLRICFHGTKRKYKRQQTSHFLLLTRASVIAFRISQIESFKGLFCFV
jgi:hypothetical protein